MSHYCFGTYRIYFISWILTVSANTYRTAICCSDFAKQLLLSMRSVLTVYIFSSPVLTVFRLTSFYRIYLSYLVLPIFYLNGT